MHPQPSVAEPLETGSSQMKCCRGLDGTAGDLRSKMMLRGRMDPQVFVVGRLEKDFFQRNCHDPDGTGVDLE